VASIVATAGDETDGARIGIAVAGREHTLSAEDVILTMKAPEGYSVEREGAHAVALDLTIDDDLRAEGQAREIVHAIQNARKAAGLEVEDRIELWLAGAPALIEAAEAHRNYLTGETLAVELNLNREEGPNNCYSEQTEIDGLSLSISLRRS
jgi:isoleucyl-tRNA synthetase